MRAFLIARHGNAPQPEHEVHAARYYYRRGAFLAAVNRAQQAVKDYDGAPANEEALYIMVRSYDALNLPDLRDDTARVMEKNFPNSDFIKYGARKKDKSWWEVF